MNKKIEITELMREYTDDEFNIEGENAADTEKVVENVMGQVKPKVKTKPFKVLIAAAAAAACIAGGTAAATTFFTEFTTAAGRGVSIEKTDDGWIEYGTLNGLDTLVISEDGRLYFNVNGKSADITELADRKTPYIYSYTIAETGEPAYIIAGGTPDNYGVVDMYYTEGVGWQGDGAINGDAVGSFVKVSIGDPSDRYAYASGWYRSNMDFFIWYDSADHRHFHGSEVDILPTWRDECEDAWFIEGLVQLGLLELPDAANFDAPVLQVNDDGKLIWVSHGMYADLTEKISEDTPYIFDMIGGDDKECYFVFGGTVEDHGWAIISRYDDEYWTIGDENITDADGQLREWYVNAVEQKGFDLEQLQRNYFFS